MENGELSNIIQKRFDAIDTWILTASLGAFGVTFAFINSTSINFERLGLLYFSWGFFAASAACILSTMVICAWYERAILIAPPDKKDLAALRNKKVAPVTAWMSFIAVGLFIIALGLAVSFAIKQTEQRQATLSQKNGLANNQPIFINNTYYNTQK